MVRETAADALNCRMYKEDSFTASADSVRNQEPRSWKLSWLYPEEDNFLYKTSVKDEGFAEYGSSILRNMQSLTIAAQQYADNIIGK